ncbi:MAG: UDP-N-acetylmuramoyl-L-alanine--D-glutamate ligase [Candidatus Omnitrophica bacterium]|nr:UDP-N-acetylmuramoyl-L-alanine--D-glutamate ligase [Candidatus Omnitrophota bacterium]
MKKIDFKGKKVGVVGLAKSGLAASLLLKDLGAQVWVTDVNDNDTLRKNLSILNSQGINKVELGRHSEEFIKGKDLLVVSPGVSNASWVILRAEELRIPIISEIELAYLVCPAKIIAVTGTNGKTTVTTLIGRVIQASGKKAVVCGNIGNPFTQEVGKLKEGDFVSLEVSSFQLERIKDFKPFISVILNFTPDHLDRYKDIQEYLAAKKRIYINQDSSDFVVLNYDDLTLRNLNKEIKANVRYFKERPNFNPNQSAVIEVADILGIERDLCLEILHNFKGIEHRLESVLEFNRIEFINDSKATNVDSTIWALKNIQKPINLIAGGRDKGIDYALVGNFVKDKVKTLILIGEAKDKIKNVLGKIVPCLEATSLEEAVKIAYENADAGDCVLLSPMCASFDMFLNYEERGRVFKKAVFDLAEGQRCGV